MQVTPRSPITGEKRKFEDNDQTGMLGNKKFDDGSQKTQDLAQQNFVKMQQMMGMMTELSKKIDKLDNRLDGIEPIVQQMYGRFLEQDEEATPIIEPSTPDISEEDVIKSLFNGLFFPSEECELLLDSKAFTDSQQKQLHLIEQQAATQQENKELKIPNEGLIESTEREKTPAFHSIQSPKHANQDCYTSFSMEVYYNNKMCPADFFAIFDGHGPAKEEVSASIYCRNHVKNAFMKCAKMLNTEGEDYTIANTLKMTFVILDSMYKSYMELNYPKEKRPGTTAVLMVIVDGDLYVANCGDSRAILSKGKTGEWMQLSYDFKSSDPYAQKTTLNRGGKIKYAYGSNRVDGSLAVTRSIGDEYLRDKQTQIKHISPRPKVVKLELKDFITNPDHASLLLATDGFFDVASTKQTADTLCDLLKSNYAPETIASAFSQAARNAGSQDDITVGIIPLQKYS